MPKPQEVAAVVALGQRYDIWKTISITRQFFEYTIVDMRLTVAEIGSLRHGWKSLRLKPGDPAQGFLAGQPAISGHVWLRQTAYGPNDHAVEIGVVSLSNSVMASTVDGNPGQYDNATISQ